MVTVTKADKYLCNIIDNVIIFIYKKASLLAHEKQNIYYIIIVEDSLKQYRPLNKCT